MKNAKEMKNVKEMKNLTVLLLRKTTALSSSNVPLLHNYQINVKKCLGGLSVTSGHDDEEMNILSSVGREMPGSYNKLHVHSSKALSNRL